MASHGSLPPVVAAYLDAYNRKDVDGMLACLAASVAFRNIADGVVSVAAGGKAEFEALARAGAAAFASRRQKVTHAITVAETTAIEIEFEAMVAADLPNGWKAGETVSFAGRSLFRTEGGKITEIVDEV